MLHGLEAFDGDVSRVSVLELSECSFSSQLIDACQCSLRELCLVSPEDEDPFVIDAKELSVLALCGSLDGRGFVKQVSTPERHLEALLLHGVVFEHSDDQCLPIRTRRLLLGGRPSFFSYLASRVEANGVQSLALHNCDDIPMPHRAVLVELGAFWENLLLFATNEMVIPLPELMPNLKWLCLRDCAVFQKASHYLTKKLEEVGLLQDNRGVSHHDILTETTKALFARWSLCHTDLFYGEVSHFWVHKCAFQCSLPAIFDFFHIPACGYDGSRFIYQGKRLKLY